MTYSVVGGGTTYPGYLGTLASKYPGTLASKYPGTQVPLNPHFRCWQADSMEPPPIYGVLGVRKVINNNKKNIKEKNYRR